jgi:hypothetical protein
VIKGLWKRVSVIIIAAQASIILNSTSAQAAYYDFESPTLSSDFIVTAIYGSPYWGNPGTPPQGIDPARVYNTNLRSYAGSQSLNIGTTWTNSASGTNVKVPLKYNTKLDVTWMQYDQFGGQSPYYMVTDFSKSDYNPSYRIINYDLGWGNPQSNHVGIERNNTAYLSTERIANSWSKYEVSIDNGTIHTYVNDSLIDTVYDNTKVDSINFGLAYYFGFLGPQSYQIDNLNIQSDVTPTPIPPAFLLMGSGLIGLSGFRRSKIIS